MPREAYSGCRGQHPGREQRLRHPFGVAAVPPRALPAALLRTQVLLDLPRGRRPQFGDGGHDVVDQLRVLLDDLGAPPTVRVLAHPPAQQRPVVDGHQRGLVRPVLDEQPGRPGGMAPCRTVEHVAVIGPEPAEHRRIVGAHRHRHRIHLQHLDPCDESSQVRSGDGAARFRLAETLCGDGDPAGLGDRQRRHGRT